MILREDGFLEIQLDESMVFDEYLYSLIQEDPHCLSCIRDHRKAHHYYYDLHGLQSIKDYLNCQTSLDLLTFGIQLFTTLWKVSSRKKIIFDCDFLFINTYGNDIRVLCLPVGRIEEDVSTARFLKSLCELFRYANDHEALGMIYAAALQNKALKELLDSLLAIQKKRYDALPFWKRWKIKHQKEKNEVQKVPIASSRRLLPSELFENETQVLCIAKQAYFEDIETKKRFYITDEMTKIGRAHDNQWVISSLNVSSYHACFVLSQQKIMDLGSLNGTYVNDVKIEECMLQNEDRVRFAMQTYVYYEGS